MDKMTGVFSHNSHSFSLEQHVPIILKLETIENQSGIHHVYDTTGKL